MKRVKISARSFIITTMLMMTAIAKGQDAHFAGIQEMNLWYNPSLKTTKLPDAHVSIRSVNYPDIIAYTSKAATIELPLIGKDKSADDNIFFMNLAAGISTDNSADHFMNVSTAMMALSYALPLNDNNTCLAFGFQGNYSFSRVGSGGPYHFPDGFDKYGALASAMANDPFQSGLNYGYFTAGVGVSIFHSGAQTQWYAGGSIRHFNHPYTEWTHAARLPGNDGMQAGYTTAVTDRGSFGGYVNFSWQGGRREQIIGALYSRRFGDNDDSTNNSFTIGTAYRVGDALAPNLGLTFGQNQFAVYYEINLSTTAAGTFKRKVFEFSYKRDL